MKQTISGTNFQKIHDKNETSKIMGVQRNNLRVNYIVLFDV